MKNILKYIDDQILSCHKNTILLDEKIKGRRRNIDSPEQAIQACVANARDNGSIATLGIMSARRTKLKELLEGYIE